MSILITGSNGFLGKPLGLYLQNKGLNVMGIQRQKESSFPVCVIPDLYDIGDWRNILNGKETIIHLAARAHQTNEKNTTDTEKLYLKNNVAVTQKLAEAASAAKVKHFIFISSVAAYPFDPETPMTPQISTLQKRWLFYGKSKYLAERFLEELRLKSSMKITILRPPLFYGPGVKGNFLSLIQLCQKNYPLPFKNFNNKKSVLSVDNFCDLMVQLMENEKSWQQKYFIKDDDVSIQDILKTLYEALGKDDRLFSLPSFLFRLLEKTPYLKGKIQRLTEDLVFDDAPIRDVLDWTPPYDFKKGIAKMVQSYQ